AFALVVAMAAPDDGSDPVPTVFFVPRDAPGMVWGRQPRFTNNTLYGHPELRLDGVRVGPEDVLGWVGQGISLTHDWFREERLMIAARCVGAARRCLDEA